MYSGQLIKNGRFSILHFCDILSVIFCLPRSPPILKVLFAFYHIETFPDLDFASAPDMDRLAGLFANPIKPVKADQEASRWVYSQNSFSLWNDDSDGDNMHHSGFFVSVLLYLSYIPFIHIYLSYIPFIHDLLAAGLLLLPLMSTPASSGPPSTTPCARWAELCPAASPTPPSRPSIWSSAGCRSEGKF